MIKMNEKIKISKLSKMLKTSHIDDQEGGARGVMVIVVGNGHDDTSSNPGPG